MYFDATPLNVVTLLVMVPAVMALIFLSKGRFDSNLPLLFYGFAFTLVTSSERQISPFVLYTGLAFALILRFEFMGKGVTKFVAVLTSCAIGLVLLAFLGDMLTGGRGLF